MQKELFLIRHAAAESSDFDIKDIDRRLTTDGEIMATKTGKFLRKLTESADVFLCSTSERTRQTAALIVEQLILNPNQIEYTEDLYEASTRILLRVLTEINSAANKVIVVGHNPSITYLSEYITGAEIGNVEPSGIVHLKYKGEWAGLTEKSADLVQYFMPELMQ